MSSSRGSRASNPFESLASSDEEEMVNSSGDELGDPAVGFLADLDGFDFDTLDTLLRGLEVEDFTNAFGELGDEVTNAMLDLLGHPGVSTEEKLKPTRREYPASACLKETRSVRLPELKWSYKVGPYRVESRGGVVVLLYPGGEELIGISKIEDCGYDLPAYDAMRAACEINESTKTKGTAMGFSSFVHSLAICAIAAGDGLLEPHAGNDLISHKISMEMTGLNYERRETRSMFVLNKYAIVMTMLEKDADLTFILDASLHEDRFDPTYLYSSAFDQGAHHYTESVRRQVESVKSMTDSNFLNVANMLRSWLSREPLSEADAKPDKLSDSKVNDALKLGGKMKEGVLMYPAPLRVLPAVPIDDPRFDPRTFQVDVWSESLVVGPSTFRNLTIDVDPLPMLLELNAVELPQLFEDGDRLVNWIHSKMSRYAGYASLWVESELIPKIAGRVGYFMSRHSGCGICWKATSSASLTWFANFYRVGNPGPSCGTWCLINGDWDIWMSPTFKVSVNDMNHAKIQAHRLVTMVSALCAYCNDRERPSVVESLIVMSAMSRGSSWQTSVFSKDFRFLVLNMISRTGDPQSQIDALKTKVLQPLSACDYLLLRQVKLSVSRFNACEHVTPMFGLPYRFMNIEKDFSLTTMWHMRKLRTPFDTVKKLIKAAAKEILTRSEEQFYDECQELALEQINAGTLTQWDFDALVAVRPEHPHFNLVFFIGLSYIACHGTGFGTAQRECDVRLSTLTSDKRCVTVSKINNQTVDCLTLKQERVADAMASFFSSHGDPPSVFHLVSRVARGPQVDYINFCVEKGAKGGNREIPQMVPANRLQQFFSEKNLSIYVDQEEVDFMTDSSKFSKFAEDTSKILRLGGRISSEDKSSFCHNFQPDRMGLAILCIARMTGSTGMVSSAAFLLTDTKRYTILPVGVLETDLPDSVERTTVNLLSGKKVERLIMTSNYKNFQQGQRAYAGACINTVFVKAWDILMKESFPSILLTGIRTTSDDSSRAIATDRDGDLDTDLIKTDYFKHPIEYNNLCMMENSADKYMESEMFGEFNNVTAGPQGLFNSSLTNAVLSIQPLTGDNPYDDLVTLVSAAKSTLPWGTSLDVMRTALATYLVQYRQKWLFTVEEIEYMYMNGFIPQTDAELIEGFAVRNNQMRVRLVGLLDNEQRQAVLRGELELTAVLRQFRVRDSKKKRNQLVTFVPRSAGLAKTFKRINMSRLVRGRANASTLRPLAVGKRASVKRAFFDLISTPLEDLSEETKLIADSMIMPCAVKVLPMYPRAKHLLPFNMGDSRSSATLPNMNRVRLKRLTGLSLTDPLTNQELEISLLDEDAFLKEEFRVETAKIKLGAQWLSPGGCSLFRFLDGRILRSPMAFTYTVDLPVENYRTRPIEIGGEEYTDYKPIHLSGFLLNRISKSNGKLAFGTGWRGDRKFAFFMSENSRVKVVLMQDVKNPLCTVQSPHLDKMTFVPNVEIYTPVDIRKFDYVERPWVNNAITGDPTAILNYGNYLNTNGHGVGMVRKKIFQSFGSREPGWSQSRLHEWPYFIPGSKVVEGRHVNMIVGSRMACFLKITFTSDVSGYQTIDVSTNHIEVKPGYLPAQEEEEMLLPNSLHE